jgi:putative ABC transport system substrate-binding protein
VIAASPNPLAVNAAKAASTTIPIVFYSGPDPVRTGLVASLNRPGGNLTGVTALSADLTAKRLGLLHDLAPSAATVAMLLVETAGGANAQLEDTQSAGRSIGVRIVGVPAGSVGEFDAAFEIAVREGAGALLVSTNIFFINNRDRLIALAAAHKLPAIYQERTFADAGGLMSYGPSPTDAHRQLGVYTGRVLKGEKPADLPVLLPTKFDFVINLKTAKALSITVPPGLLASADEVIE